METFLNALRSLKLWQIGVLIAVLFGAAGATYGVYAWVSGSGQTRLREDQQLIPVQYGNLVNQVSTNGSLIFPNRETLTFGTQGTVGEVLVEEGEQVEAGQPLARLDQAAGAALEKAVAQARVNLQNAEEALAEARTPHTDLEIAQAEAVVTNAKLSLESAEDALVRLLQPTSEDIAQAEAAVTDAKLSVKKAQEALDAAKDGPTEEEIAKAEAAVTDAKLSVKNAQETLDAAKDGPTEEEVAQAEAAVTDAKLSVKNAQEALDAAKDGPTEEEIAKAQLQVDSSDTTLANALGDLKLAQREWDDKLEAAQEVFDTAVEDYQTVFEKWLGIQLGEEEVDMAPDTLLESWGVDLDVLFDPDLRFEQKWSIEGPPPDDPATPWSEVVVYIWLNLHPDRIVPTCDGEVSSGELCVEKEIDDAWDSYQDAKDNLDTVQTQAAKAIANAESAVTRGEESLASAQEALAELQEAPDPLEIESKENQLELALASLQVAEEDLAELTDGADPLEIESKQRQLELAQATLEMAEEDLANLTNDPDPLEVEAKQKQVEVAQLSLDKAKEDLAELKSSVDPLDVALREADVASARMALETALQELEYATLWAPMGGIVDVVNVEAGQEVNANAPIIDIVDPTVVEVDGIVDEIDVLFIQEGARATVTMDALPGQELEGTVSTISSAATSQQGVVSYPIRIWLEVPEGVQLREGLSATANIVIREERNVLLVPLQALYGTFQQPVVQVMTDGGIEERVVVLGNSDDFWVVVREGLSEGERVVMEVTQATTSQFGFGTFRQFQGQIPGAFPSGGGQRR